MEYSQADRMDHRLWIQRGARGNQNAHNDIVSGLELIHDQDRWPRVPASDSDSTRSVWSYVPTRERQVSIRWSHLSANTWESLNALLVRVVRGRRRNGRRP